MAQSPERGLVPLTPKGVTRDELRKWGETERLAPAFAALVLGGRVAATVSTADHDGTDNF